MFNTIKTHKDIKTFLNTTNELHDAYIIDAKYSYNGITKTEGGHFFEPYKTNLTLQILVTSIYDAIVEIEFENLLEWQIKSSPEELLTTTVILNDKYVIWSVEPYIDMNQLKESTYVIASVMKWRIIEQRKIL